MANNDNVIFVNGGKQGFMQIWKRHRFRNMTGQLVGQNRLQC